jgi:hypothetical protein
LKSNTKDLILHYDEENKKIVFYATDAINTADIRGSEFNGVSPEINYFQNISADEAEKQMGSLVFSMIDTFSTEKIGIRDYESIIIGFHEKYIDQLEKNALNEDHESQYLLSNEYHASARKNKSHDELEKAEVLLKASANGGHQEAITKLKHWPRMKASAKRGFNE